MFTQTQEFIPSPGKYPAGEVHPEDEYCINVCLVRKIQNKIKRVPGGALPVWVSGSRVRPAPLLRAAAVLSWEAALYS